MDVAAFLLALVPIIWLVVMLLCFKWPAWKAAIGSFALSCVFAFAWWHLPAAQIATASLEGLVLRWLYGGHGRLWDRRCQSRRHARGPWF